MTKPTASIRRVIAAGVNEPPAETWSNCLVVDGIAYVAGMTARGGRFDEIVGDTAFEQAQAIFAKIRALLEAAGGSMADVVKMVIYVTDIRDREGIWQARRQFFSGDFPVSTLIGVAQLADPRMKVEIEVIAHVGAARA